HQVARRVARKRGLREHAGPRVARREAKEVEHEQVPRARDGLDAPFEKRQARGIRTSRSDGVESGFPGAVPGGRIDDRVSIRSEASGLDRTPAIRQPLKGRRWRGLLHPDETSGEEPDGGRRGQGSRGEKAWNSRAGLDRRGLQPRSGETGQCFEVEGDVAGGLKAL